MSRSNQALVAWALLLLLSVAMLHHGIDHLAQLWPDPPAARRALFYIGQGLKGCLLWVALATMLPRTRAAAPLIAVCAYGFLQDGMVAGCRIAYGIGNLPTPGLWHGVCDDLNHAPLSLAGLAVGLLAACIVDHSTKNKP